jgi:hypothetical protein
LLPIPILTHFCLNLLNIVAGLRPSTICLKSDSYGTAPSTLTQEAHQQNGSHCTNSFLLHRDARALTTAFLLDHVLRMVPTHARREFWAARCNQLVQPPCAGDSYLTPFASGTSRRAPSSFAVTRTGRPI